MKVEVNFSSSPKKARVFKGYEIWNRPGVYKNVGAYEGDEDVRVIVTNKDVFLVGKDGYFDVLSRPSFNHDDYEERFEDIIVRFKANVPT